MSRVERSGSGIGTQSAAATVSAGKPIRRHSSQLVARFLNALGATPVNRLKILLMWL